MSLKSLLVVVLGITAVVLGLVVVVGNPLDATKLLAWGVASAGAGVALTQL